MTNDQLRVFMDRIQSSNISSKWRDGLGLMTPQDRWHHMAQKALGVFNSSLKDGLSTHAAIDKALGLDGPFRGNRTDVIYEGVTAPRCSLSELT